MKIKFRLDFFNCLIILLILAIVFACGFSVGNQNEQELISPLPQSRGLSPVLAQSPTTYYIGQASYYDQSYCDNFNPGCLTASGDKFNENAFTSACSSHFKLGSRLLVSYQGRSIEVVCTDRGSFQEKYSRILDLSKASFEALAPLSAGTITVTIKEIK